MAYNGSGVFTRLYTWVTDKANSVPITAARMDGEFDGIKTALDTCLLKNGTQIVTANIPMATFKFTGLGDGSAVTDSAAYGQIAANAITQSGVYVATVAGTADAITLTPSPAITAYAAGQKFAFIASGTNTVTAPTVAVSALASPKTITKNGTTALSAGDIVSGALTEIIYDGTRFQLIGGVPVAGATVGATTFTSTLIGGW